MARRRKHAYQRTRPAVGAHLADDARHVRCHVLDDADDELDGLHGPTVVDAHLAVESLLDTMGAEPAKVRGRRRLREALK